MNINEKKWIESNWPVNQYFGIDESMKIHDLGLYDCWEDLEYEVNLDQFVWVFTRKELANFISRAVIILNRKGS